MMKRQGLMVAAFVVAMVAAADELEVDWLAQDGAAATNNVSHEAWRAQMLARRARRLAPVAAFAKKWVYCRHYVMGGSHYAYTEALSDAKGWRSYAAIGSSLCMAEYDPSGLWKETVLLETKEGCFRDVDVSPDGTRILYSFKASADGDDFHLYEMTLADRSVRQLTHGKAVADYEGCYLPDGRILFNSTRCIQVVDCVSRNEVSNLYRCEADGSNITRISFDQVHDNYPALAWDGRILYTRWDYNDRSQMFTQPLFSMNADGTNQRALYGGNSWFPTSLLHARAVPGSQLFFGVCTGHHTLQPGELMRFDPREGREEADGAWQLAPLRRAKARKGVDVDGQNGRLAMYPYPVDERNIVLSYLPQGWRRDARGRLQYIDHRAPFALYWTDVDGARELLVAQAGKSPCGRPVPVRARTLPKVASVRPDEKLKTGMVAVQDVYAGEAMKGVARGTVKSLRVVSLQYRQAGVGFNSNGGPGGGGVSSTPPALGNGTWDVKRVLGEVPVAEDGSVAFRAPVRAPIFFQLLDENGRMVQTMRSWAVLQPGETASCVGCHEPANIAPDFRATKATALDAIAEVKLPKRGFSFAKDVQPILERRCVRCHSPHSNAGIPDLTGMQVRDMFSCRNWSRAYLTLTQARHVSPPFNHLVIPHQLEPKFLNGNFRDKNGRWVGDPYAKNGYVNWISSASEPTLLPPLTHGSRISRLFTERLDKGHAKGITDAEKRMLACWVDLGVPFCGDYEEGAVWSEEERAFWSYYTKKRAEFATAAELLE